MGWAAQVPAWMGLVGPALGGGVGASLSAARGLVLGARPAGSLRHAHRAPAPIFAFDPMTKQFYGDLAQDHRCRAARVSLGGAAPGNGLAGSQQPGAGEVPSWGPVFSALRVAILIPLRAHAVPLTERRLCGHLSTGSIEQAAVVARAWSPCAVSGLGDHSHCCSCWCLFF